MHSLRRTAVFLLLAFGLRCAAAQVLQVGDPFPPVTAHSLSGGTLTLPDTHATVVLVGFTRASGDDSSRWSARLVQDFPTLPADDLIFLDSAPGFLRGMIASAIRNGMTPQRQAHSAIMDRDSALWKSRLKGSDLSHAVVLVLDATGHIRAILSGPVTDAAYARLRSALSTLPDVMARSATPSAKP